MSRRIRKATPPPEHASKGLGPRVSGALRADQVIAGGHRLAILALAASCAIVITSVVDRLAFPLSRGSPGAALWLFGAGGGLCLSLGMALVAGRGWLSSEKLLDVGLVYEVLQALTAGLTFHAVAFAPNLPSRGSSPVSLWVLAYALIVPNTRRRTLVATIAAALMDPFSLAISVAAGMPRPGAAAAALSFMPTAISAAVAIVVSRQMYELAVAAAHGREVGSYQLEERIGSGGMGEVWKASHRMLARPAAIKLIRFDPLFDSGLLVKRFEREARATAALRSPHTVDVYDYGTAEDGRFYYVMELLEGFDLETLVERFGSLPPERVAFLLEQACHSLAEAHERGLIHRDVKPANMFVSRYGIDWDFVKLLDFGIVKDPVADAGGAVTSARVIAGTPAYMSPEMALGSGDVDWRCDIYALGCVAYWLVTGKQVFEGPSSTQIISDHIRKHPTPPGRRAETPVPPELEQIIMACLEKDPANRPQSARELGAKLRSIAFTVLWTEERARRWWIEHEPRAWNVKVRSA